MIKKVLHHSFAVEDLSKITKFYENLGFVKRTGFEKEDGTKAFLLRLGDFELEIWEINDKNSKHYSIKDHIAFEVDSVESELNRFQAEGCEVMRPVTPGNTVKCYAFIKAPDGQIYELVELKEEK